MFFDPFGFFDELDARYYCAITGRNRSGKDLISLAIARHYLDRGFRFLYNKPSIWSDDYLFSLPYDQWFDANDQTNIVFVFSEGGWNFRTMESYKQVLITIGMLNNRLLIPSRTLPHEDMQQFLLYPSRIHRFNPWFQIWSFQIWDFANESPVIRPLFWFFPRRYFALYQTGGYPSRSSLISEKFVGLNEFYQARSGASTLDVSDLAKPGQGVAMGQFGLAERLASCGIRKSEAPAGKKK